MQKQSGVNHSMSKKAQARRVRVIDALNIQLRKGTKVQSDETGVNVVPLTEHDRERINKELHTLKQRV